MKRFVISIWALLFVLTLSAAPKAGHYAQLDGNSAAGLCEAIGKAASQGYRSLRYDGLWTAFKTTDVRPDGMIWDMYSDCSFRPGTNQCGVGGNYSKECDCYNREHSVPKSWWGGSESNQGCDIFILVPTDGYVNNRRSNYPFGEVGTPTYTYDGAKLGKSNFSGYSGTVFEPNDEYKGDFARGIMGAMLKWRGDWTQKEGNSTFTGKYTSAGNYGFTAYGMALLMKWHREDPVSQKELDRNDGIEKTQGNRNPFIDYPCLAEYLWGNKKDQKLDLSKIMSAYDPKYFDSDQSGCSCTTTDIEQLPAEPVYLVQVSGNNLSIVAQQTVNMAVYDVMGRMLTYQTTDRLDIALPTGIYLLQIDGTTQRIMIP
ncbi:MAG: endonuclease [Paludibacteraceae bacterium]